jgi:hypothetical protein
MKWRWILAASCAATLVTAGVSAPVRGAVPYLLRTTADYRLDPAAKAASITIAVSFTNTTPDPTGGFSSFGSVPISLQAGASRVVARDGRGALRVSLAHQAARSVANVALRAPLRYGSSATFTLSYRLTDAANPQVRIRTSSVALPIWGFGTASSVSVRVPVGYSPRVIGGPMASSRVRDQVLFRSGAIRDPSRWSALLVGAQPGSFVTVARQVALPGGTVDLQIRSFADDRHWGAAMLDQVAEGLRAVQHAIGLPYTGVGPLVVTESLPSGIGPSAEAASGAQEIAIAFDATPFTVLHQLAHVWVGSQFASERWIREGLASHVAEVAARQLHLAVPQHAANSVTTPARGAVVPLAAWSPPRVSGAPNANTDAWAYTASWAFMDSLAATIGEDRLARVVQEATNDSSTYGGPTEAGSNTTAHEPLDSRRLLDLAEQADPATSARIEAAFRARIFPPSAAAQLDLRARARAAYASLVGAAGGWGAPDPVRSAMQEWRFDDALRSIAVAQAWLSDRDQLLDAARLAGLFTPDRLAARWRTDGGDSQARRELDAETAFLAAYRDAGERIDPLNPIERLGVLGGDDPNAVLATAGGLYASGDLDAAAAAIERALNLDAGAQGAGVVRMAAGLAALSVIAAGVVLAARRVRRWLPSPVRS